MATFHEEVIRNIIVAKISRFVRKYKPSLVCTIRKDLIPVMDEQLRVLQADWEVGQLGACIVTFKEFDICRVPYFFWSRSRSSVCVGLQMWRAPITPAFVQQRPRSSLQSVFCVMELESGGARLFRTSNLMRSSLCIRKILSLDSRGSLCRRLRFNSWSWRF